MLKEVLGEILTFLHIPALGSLYPQLNQFRAIWVLELFVVFFFFTRNSNSLGLPGGSGGVPMPGGDTRSSDNPGGLSQPPSMDSGIL